MKKKAYPILISLVIALCAFAGTFIGHNISVFLDIYRHPERRAALDTAWAANEIAAAAVTAAVFALIFMAVYFYRQEKQKKAGAKKGGASHD